MIAIDAHGHIGFEFLDEDFRDAPWPLPVQPKLIAQFEKFKKAGPEGIGFEITHLMDEKRIDTMAISINSEFLYSLPPEKGQLAFRKQNDALAKLNRGFPQRLIGLAGVPLQDTNLAIQELRRAVNELRLCGVGLSANMQGIHLGNPRFLPFWETVADMDLFVFIHPSPFKPHISPTLEAYHLMNLIGNPLDTGITAADIVFSGLFERYPTLKVLLAHAGGVMPWLMGRWQHGYEVRPECTKYLKHSPLDSIGKFYVDTIVHHPSALNWLIETFGADHVMLGSDFPADMGQDSPVGEVEDLDISDEDKAKILGGNAVRLMGLNLESPN